MQDELLDQVKALIAIAKENHLKTFTVQKGDFSLHLETEESIKPANTVLNQSPLIQEKNIEDHLITVTAPLVGTFYRAPSPNASPFVEVGDIVEPRQVLCIIEAMKVMNEISADIDGKIVEIIPENGQIVDFGHVLFKIEPIQDSEEISL